MFSFTNVSSLLRSSQGQETCSCCLPVGLSGEDPDHSRFLVYLKHVGEGLKDVKVEEGVSGDRTVETGLRTHTHTGQETVLARVLCSFHSV